MAFGSAGSYARFMGRFSEPLAPAFADLVEVPFGGRVLDVGCGPGVLTAELVSRHGVDHVDAIDPNEPFVAATRERLPGVEVRVGSAEALPYADDSYEASAAQLVVHFMKDPVLGLGEMARVTRPGGRVAACVWDHGGGRGPLSLFWEAAAALDPEARSESSSPGSREGDLERLLGEAGLTGVVGGQLSVSVPLASFEDWWAPFEEPAGSVGDYLATRTPDQVVALREQCRAQLPAGRFEVTVWTWVATGRSPIR